MSCQTSLNASYNAFLAVREGPNGVPVRPHGLGALAGEIDLHPVGVAGRSEPEPFERRDHPGVSGGRPDAEPPAVDALLEPAHELGHDESASTSGATVKSHHQSGGSSLFGSTSNSRTAAHPARACGCHAPPRPKARGSTYATRPRVIGLAECSELMVVHQLEHRVEVVVLRRAKRTAVRARARRACREVRTGPGARGRARGRLLAGPVDRDDLQSSSRAGATSWKRLAPTWT